MTPFWNGTNPLPSEIHVVHSDRHMAEFELLSVLCSLHGYVTAFDLLSGSEPNTEKDTDLISVLTAFQFYLAPRLPLSCYTRYDKRITQITNVKTTPIHSKESS